MDRTWLGKLKMRIKVQCHPGLDPGSSGELKYELDSRSHSFPDHLAGNCHVGNSFCGLDLSGFFLNLII